MSPFGIELHVSALAFWHRVVGSGHRVRKAALGAANLKGKGGKIPKSGNVKGSKDGKRRKDGKSSEGKGKRSKGNDKSSEGKGKRGKGKRSKGKKQQL